MRVHQQCAFVLHTRPYSESSWLVEIFSQDFGRLTLIAKGARRTKSKLRGVLLPFQPLLISWSGKGELPVLTHAELASAPLTLTGAALSCGFYVNELLVRLLHRHDPHKTLFRAYADTLNSLSLTGQQETKLRSFEKALLRELGYALAVEADADTQEPIERESMYRYIPEQGAFKVTSTNGKGLCVKGATLLAIAREQWSDPDSLRETKYLMRGVLRHFLGDKPLHSRRLFNDLRRANDADS